MTRVLPLNLRGTDRTSFSHFPQLPQGEKLKAMHNFRQLADVDS